MNRCPGSGGHPLRTNYVGGGLWRCGYCSKHVHTTVDGRLYAHTKRKPLTNPAVAGSGGTP